MPVTLSQCFKLKYSVTGGSGELSVIESTIDICADLNSTTAPKHFIATIYTMSQSEKVLIYGCEDGKLLVQRSFGSASRCPFPAGACIKMDEILDGRVSADTAPTSDCPDIWSRITVGKGLTLDRTDPDNPVLSLKETGVTAGSMCGATINTCGQFTFIPDNWPAVCMPVYDPCGGGSGGGGGGSVDATEVSYTPPFGSTIITQDTVSGALEDLQTYLSASSGSGNVAVTSVAAGTGLAMSGASTSPTISIAPTGVTSGIYSGFTINASGQVTGYSAPSSSVTPMSGSNGVSAGYVIGTGYDIKGINATIVAKGVVKLADEGALSSANVNMLSSLPAGDVVTVAWIEQWATLKGL